MRKAISIGMILWAGLGACSDDDSLNNNGNDQDAGPDVVTFQCGNGVQEPGEECDDGNRFNGDGCSIDCEWEGECGDGVQQPPEECDDTDGLPTCVQLGFIDGTTTCSASCLVEEDCTNDASGLVAWYKLDGASGVVVDSTFSGNGCTTEGAVQREFPGVIDYAFFFNGSDAYTDCGPGTNMGGMAGLTVEVWVRLSAFSPEGMFISRAVDPTHTAYHLGIAGGSSWGTNQYHVFFGAASLTEMAFSSDVMPTDQWHHVAGVYQAGNLILYIDGVESGTATQSDTGPILADMAARTYLAHMYDSSGMSPLDTFYEGYLDDVKVWAEARTQAQVCADAGGTPAGQGGCDLTVP